MNASARRLPDMGVDRPDNRRIGECAVSFRRTLAPNHQKNSMDFDIRLANINCLA
jgi:hypothetical protein